MTEKMPPDTNQADEYEDNPWEGDEPGDLVRVADFLPPASMLANALIHMKPDGASVYRLPPEDAEAIEKMAALKGVPPTALIAGLIHDFAAGNLVKRGK